MKKFEREVLKYIVSLEEDGKPIPIHKILSKYMSEKGIRVTNMSHNHCDAYILFNSAIYTEKKDGVIVITNKHVTEFYPTLVIISKIMLLLEKLEEEAFINIICLANSKKRESIFYKSSTLPLQLIIPDKKITDILYNYLGKDIFLSEELIAYVKNDFRNEEQRKYRMANIISVCALITAFVASILAGIIPPLMEKDTSINKEQFVELTSVLNEQNKTIDSLNLTLKQLKSDTINVKIRTYPHKSTKRK